MDFKLYEINNAIRELVHEGGEEMDGALNDLKLAWEEKAEAICILIKERRAVVEMIKKEIDTLKARIESEQRTEERLKKYLMTHSDGRRLKTPRVSLSYRKSTSVEIDEMTDMDPKYYHVITETKYYKNILAEDLRAGKEIQGARLVERNNIIIK